MMRIRHLVSGLLVVFLTLPAAAQPALPVQVNLDLASFGYDAQHSLLEVYLAFEAQSLPFVQEEGQYRATLPVALVLMRNTDATLGATPQGAVWQDSLTLRFVVADTSALAEGQHFLHQVRAAVPPGEYELQVRLPGARLPGSAARQDLELRRDVVVPNYQASDLVGLSDITLASAIDPSQDRDDPFYKNGLLIRPNANLLFGQGLPLLYYYAEAYNPASLAGDDGRYTVLTYVAEANRPQPLPGLERRLERTPRSPDIVAGSFDLSMLPSGAYFLRVALLNDANEAVAENARKFFVYNPNVARPKADGPAETFETSPYAVMPQEEVERALAHISVIATETERRRARDIRDLDEQRRFLMEFWQARDPRPDTPINEFKEEFYSRLQYANERYASGRREGWQTDRGRIVIKYGLPASVEPHLYDRETIPHEIWQYNNIPGEGQALFVFADRNRFGDFELLHATVAGERKMLDWQAQLRQ